MAKLIIQRTSEYTNRMRSYGIYVDGNKVGTIGSGDVKEFQIPPGQHKLYAKIDWCSSPELEFETGDTETKLFKVGAFKNANWLMPLALGIVIVSFIIKKTTGIDYFLFLVIPIVLLLLYYLTIGRKNYLTLTPL